MSTLRANNIQDLNGNNKDVGSLVDNQTIVDRINYASDAEFNAAKTGKVSLDANKRLRMNSLLVGAEAMTSSAPRDLVVAAPTINGLTDFHFFAAQGIVTPTDPGTIGVFDITTKLRGATVINHMFGYQMRAAYEGSGTLQRFAGFLHLPIHAGTGDILEAYGADISTTAISGGGTIQSQAGILIRDQVGATANAGMNIMQSTGYSLYANGGAPLFNRGRAGFGITPSTNYAVQFAGPAGGARRGFLETTATNCQIGAEGDGGLQFIQSAAIKLQIKASANGYSVTPGTDNSQTLGDAANRWSVVWAGTGTISTSDARDKTAVRKLTAAEIAAACELADEIGAYKFLASIEEKGDAAREHVGMTVQRAIEIMESHGLDPYGYSFICHDEWEDQIVEHPAETVRHPPVYKHYPIIDTQGNPIMEVISESWVEVIKEGWIEVVKPAGDRYSFRENGLYAFIAAGMKARQDSFEQRLAALEAKE